MQVELAVTLRATTTSSHHRPDETVFCAGHVPSDCAGSPIRADTHRLAQLPEMVVAGFCVGAVRPQFARRATVSVPMDLRGSYVPT